MICTTSLVKHHSILAREALVEIAEPNVMQQALALTISNAIAQKVNFSATITVVKPHTIHAHKVTAQKVQNVFPLDHISANTNAFARWAPD